MIDKSLRNKLESYFDFRFYNLKEFWGDGVYKNKRSAVVDIWMKHPNLLVNALEQREHLRDRSPESRLRRFLKHFLPSSFL